MRGCAGPAPRGVRQVSRGAAGVVAGSGKGDCIPSSTPGVFGFGTAAFPWSGSRPEPPAPPAGFPLDPPLVVSVAAIDRVTVACHVIVAPFVARVAAEHGLPDCQGRSWRPTVGTFPDSSDLMWSSAKPGPLPSAT